MKIPFDVKYRPQIKSGEYKVETMDGREVSIACWDAKRPNSPIIAEVFSKTWKGDVITLPYKVDGTTNAHPDTYLVIIAPEPELTEFEKVVAYWLDTAKYEPITNEMIVDAADNLMFIARKQIIKEAEEKAEKEGYCIEDAVAFNEGFKTAKELYSRTEEKIAKRLPTIEEWKWLINNCKWEWDDARKGQIITAKNGNSIFLPAAGYRDGTRHYSAGYGGHYWSSSIGVCGTDNVYNISFDTFGIIWGHTSRRYGKSVRPVSDIPMEGFVDMGNNLFWAEKNEEGYFTYDEAMKLFNS